MKKLRPFFNIDFVNAKFGKKLNPFEKFLNKSLNWILTIISLIGLILFLIFWFIFSLKSILFILNT